MSNLSAIILAAGEGKRMKSKYSKVLHKVAGKAIVELIVDAAEEAGVEECVLIVGHKAEDVKAYIGNRVKYALQEVQLGTGHAVMQAESVLDSKDGYTIVFYGDSPLITAQSITEILDFHINNNNAVTAVSTEIDNPTGYGRIVRDKNGEFLNIVEHKDATEEQRKIKEVNTGPYCFTTKLLFEALKEVKNNNAQGEYYITDTIEILRSKGYKAGAKIISESTEVMGINSRQQLAEAQKAMTKRINNKHMTEGVTIIDPNTTYISADAQIGRDTIIYPGTIIEGKTIIGEDCVVGPFTRIIDSTLGNDVRVENSVVVGKTIGDGTCVGPFENLK